MANSKELTAQVAELYKKQTEEMKALEEQREEALKAERFDESAIELHKRNRHGRWLKSSLPTAPKKELFKEDK